MVAYNFQSRFAPAVADGSKRQTVRGPRKRHAHFGEPVQLYTGLRTKAARKLVTPDPVCVVSCGVVIHADTVDWVMLPDMREDEKKPFMALLDAMDDDLDTFAQADGFADWSDMRAWFAAQYGLPFQGVLIAWEPAP